MNITKKFGTARQWAGEKMGSEVKTTLPEEFKMMETEMALRYDGMDRLQRSASAYHKWLKLREGFESKTTDFPVKNFGSAMASHGGDFDGDSLFGSRLYSMGMAHEQIAGIHDKFIAELEQLWLEPLTKNVNTIKEYQTARKKLETRRLVFDASLSKEKKARRDDFRAEEEVRTSRAKYDESTEEVKRRMQDIRDADDERVYDMTNLLDAELAYHEQCIAVLRQTREKWQGTKSASSGYGGNYAVEQPSPPSQRPSWPSSNGRLSRTSTNGSSYSGGDRDYGRGGSYGGYDDDHEAAPPVRPIRSTSRIGGGFSGPDMPVRPTIGRSNTVSVPQSPPKAPAPNVLALRSQLRPVSRIITTRDENANVFADRDDDDTPSSSGSPEWSVNGDQSASPATSFGSISRSTSTLGNRKAPPPPPPSRAKKPAPPVPMKREALY